MQFSFRFDCDFRTCKHFLKLVEDRRLWKTFDFATKKMMGRQIKKLLSTLQIGDIEEFKARGFVSKYPIEKWKNNTITPNILRKLSSSCPNLKTIEIHEGYINFQQVRHFFLSVYIRTNWMKKKVVILFNN